MRTTIRNVLVATAAAGLLTAVNTGLPLSQGSTADPVAPAADPAVADLTSDLDEILADARLDGGQAGVVVRDAASGDVLYDRNGGTRLIPASNEKLFTSAAALDVLGPDYSFTTSVATTADQRGTVLRGDLYLRGTGDPTMLAADYAELAGQIADSGIKVVEGSLVADDTWFDSQRLGNDWSWDDEPYNYAAPVSALTVSPDTDYDAGTVIVTVTPGSASTRPAAVSVSPATDSVTVVNQATTTDEGGETQLTVEREHGSDRIVVSGVIAPGDEVQKWASVREPTRYAADVFAKALKAHGVRVRGDIEFGATPEDARPLAEHTSMPLGELLTPFLKLSNNGHAELLLKAMGREAAGEGSWSAGLGVMAEQLETYGVDTATMASRDGSGLSRRNLVPPAEIAALLDAVEDKPWFDTWHEALPIAGEADRLVGGTLRSRMADTPAAGNVHAKTGSLTGASSLSGYVTDADGDRLIFSVMFNDYVSSKPSDLEDRIAVRLATFSEDASATARDRSVEAPAVDLPDDIECSWVKAC